MHREVAVARLAMLGRNRVALGVAEAEEGEVACVGAYLPCVYRMRHDCTPRTQSK